MPNMPVSRRQFLATAAASTLVPFHLRAQPAPAGRRLRFAHGIASGDPLSDRVILWTRITPPSPVPMEVSWSLASDTAFRRVAARGSAWASSDRDFTVKIDAGGLQPGGTYYYRFECGGERSPIGRTRTLPVGNVGRVRMAVLSCSNYPFGFFNVYARVAARADLDFVLHLGDYIYEYPNAQYGDGTALGRIPAPDREAVSLADYRTRYAQYRTDPDLQEAHRQHPFITVWDDHEFANNAWRDGAENHNPDKGEGEWAVRKAAAAQAYLEWLPVRELPGRVVRIFRSFSIGTLADLMMLDTRVYGRDEQVAEDNLSAIADPDRRILGSAQEAWLFDELRASQRAGSRWRILGQQLILSPLWPANTKISNPDLWDGYQGSRARLFDFIEQEKQRDLIVLSGDVHSSWAMDLPRTPWDGYSATSGRGSSGVEFVTPAVSSLGIFAARPEEAPKRSADLMARLPHLRFVEGVHRGYLVLDVTPQRAQADWFFVPTVSERTNAENHVRSYVTESGSSHLIETSAPVPSGLAADPAPPDQKG